MRWQSREGPTRPSQVSSQVWGWSAEDFQEEKLKKTNTKKHLMRIFRKVHTHFCPKKSMTILSQISMIYWKNNNKKNMCCWYKTMPFSGSGINRNLSIKLCIKATHWCFIILWFITWWWYCIFSSLTQLLGAWLVLQWSKLHLLSGVYYMHSICCSRF